MTTDKAAFRNPYTYQDGQQWMKPEERAANVITHWLARYDNDLKELERLMAHAMRAACQQERLRCTRMAEVCLADGEPDEIPHALRTAGDKELG